MSPNKHHLGENSMTRFLICLLQLVQWKLSNWICVFVFVYLYLYLCIFICICVFVFASVYLYLHLCICISICVFLAITLHQQRCNGLAPPSSWASENFRKLLQEAFQCSVGAHLPNQPPYSAHFTFQQIQIQQIYKYTNTQIHKYTNTQIQCTMCAHFPSLLL